MFSSLAGLEFEWSLLSDADKSGAVDAYNILRFVMSEKMTLFCLSNWIWCHAITLPDQKNRDMSQIYGHKKVTSIYGI